MNKNQTLNLNLKKYLFMRKETKYTYNALEIRNKRLFYLEDHPCLRLDSESIILSTIKK